MAFDKQVFMYELFALDTSNNGYGDYMKNTLSGLTTALSEDNIVNEDVQKELLQISVKDATTNKACLKYLVKENKAVEYIGVTVTSEYTGDESINFESPSAEYKSKVLSGRATTYAIIPEGVNFDIGYINLVATSTTDKWSYDDTDVNVRTAPDNLPMSARAANNTKPFFAVGVPDGRENVAARKQTQLATNAVFDMGFNTKRLAPLSISVKTDEQSNSHGLAKVEQELGFDLYFAYKRSAGSTWRLLNKTTYGFKFSYPNITSEESNDENDVLVWSSGNVTSSNPQIVSSTPDPTAGLPSAATEDAYFQVGKKTFAYNDDALVGEFSSNDEVELS